MMSNRRSTNVRWWQPARLFGGLLALCLIWSWQACAQAPPEITTADAVRRLSANEAGLRSPVRLRGVVTFFDENLFSRFIQDETAGIYLNPSTNTPALKPGQRLIYHFVLDS